MRITLLAVAMALFTGVLPVSAQAVMQHYQLNIPRQSLDAALKDFAHQTGLQVARMSDRVDGSAIVGPIKGELSAEEALKSLLDSKGLSYRMVNERTVAIVKAGEKTTPSAGKEEGTQSKSFWDSFRVAQVDKGTSAVGSPSPEAAEGARRADDESNVGSSSARLEEIIVTAQKRTERLQDVPVPATAISADSLIESNQLRIQDYYASVPGLNLTPGAAVGSSLAIRGVTTGSYDTSPTVGITIDDVPYGSSAGLTYSADVPDIDPSDLARVEVLRGPQGTLYGASSIGGLLKYVTVDPSTAAVSGRIEGDSSSVYNGAEVGYGLRGAVNVPINDTIAVRASGYTRRDPGYVDNLVDHANGVNKTDVDGGRLSVLWRPSEAFSLKLGALLKNATADGSSYLQNTGVAPLPASGLGDLQQNVLPGTGAYNQRIRLYTANLTAKLGGVDLTVASGYGIYKTNFSVDYSDYYGGPDPNSYSETFFKVSGARGFFDTETKKFTQEIRLSSTIGSRVDWLLGAFYTNEDASPTYTPVYAENATTGALVGLLAEATFPTSYAEYAGFADLTVHFTDRFDVQFGGRESANRQVYNETDSGPLISPTLVVPTERTKDNAFTYLVTPRFKISPNSMVYARIASGYRPGGPNAGAGLGGYPDHFNPDKTVNYELGIKGDGLDHTVSLDASIYYIDWKNIQINVADPVSYSPYLANASGAKSQGVELSGQAKPLQGLTIGAWITWNDAVLTSNLPIGSGSAYGLAGDRLPYSSRWSANLSLEQAVRLWGGWTGFVGGAVSYVGDREGAFAGNYSELRPVFPSYVKTDLRAGLRYASWTFSAFANNVADKRGVLNIFLTGTNPNTQYIPPRTVGVSVERRF